jgi:SAM-dependent methyltransferase
VGPIHPERCLKQDDALLGLLSCPACRSDLRVQAVSAIARDNHIITGTLACSACGKRYPIVRGVPRFIPSPLSKDVMQTIDKFGYEWHYANILKNRLKLNESETFLDFIHPIHGDFFHDKVILDAGCGMGRFTRLAHQYGSSLMVGVDLSDSVDVAFENMRRFDNVLIIQADLASLPLKPLFDYIFCIGVLHHTKYPKESFQSLASILRPGGGISTWVYGSENNRWLIKIVNPLRRYLTSRLPNGILRFLSYFLALFLYVFSRSIRYAFNRSENAVKLGNRFFYLDYMNYLSRYGLHDQAVIVLDHLAPSIAAYIAKEELTSWFHHNHFQSVTITPRNNNSWRGFGISPPLSASSPR